MWKLFEDTLTTLDNAAQSAIEEISENSGEAIDERINKKRGNSEDESWPFSMGLLQKIGLAGDNSESGENEGTSMESVSVYKQLLTDVQTRHLMANREYQRFFDEKEAEVKHLKHEIVKLERELKLATERRRSHLEERSEDESEEDGKLLNNADESEEGGTTWKITDKEDVKNDEEDDISEEGDDAAKAYSSSQGYDLRKEVKMLEEQLKDMVESKNEHEIVALKSAEQIRSLQEHVELLLQRIGRSSTTIKVFKETLQQYAFVRDQRNGTSVGDDEEAFAFQALMETLEQYEGTQSSRSMMNTAIERIAHQYSKLVSETIEQHDKDSKLIESLQLKLKGHVGEKVDRAMLENLPIVANQLQKIKVDFTETKTLAKKYLTDFRQNLELLKNQMKINTTKEMKKMETKIEELQNEVNTAISDGVRSSRLHEDINTQLVKEKEKAKEFANLFENAKAKIDTLTVEIKELKMKIKKVSSEGEALRESRDRLENLKSNITSDRERVKSTLANTVKAYEEYQERMESRTKSHQKEIDEMKTQIEGLENELQHQKQKAADELDTARKQGNTEVEMVKQRASEELKAVETKALNDLQTQKNEASEKMEKMTKDWQNEREMVTKLMEDQQKEADDRVQLLTNDWEREREELKIETQRQKKKLEDLLDYEKKNSENEKKEAAETLAKQQKEAAETLEKQQKEAAEVLEKQQKEATEALEKQRREAAETLENQQKEAADLLSKELSNQQTKFDELLTKKIEEAKKKVLEVADQRIVTLEKQNVELSNRLMELQGNIRVFCRVRPVLPFEREKGKHHKGCVELAVTKPAGLESTILVSRTEYDFQKFAYDHVFGEDSSQSEVYSEVQPLITSFLNGYNVCLFAYGQTGSGKTYTMIGEKDNRGVNFRSMSYVFETIKERSGESGWTYSLSISVLEVYNEIIRDLCDTSKKKKDPKGLTVKMDRGSGLEVVGLKANTVETMEQAMKIIDLAAKNRAIGAHNINEHSSRSHLMVTLYLSGTHNITGTSIRSKLNMIDLAGSERLSKTRASGKELNEAKNINKSLSALGDVVAALGNTSSKKKSNYVPYRNSKLTYLLQDSLSGNSKVLMFVNISPVRWHVSESICSLQFAKRCKETTLGQAKKGIESELVKSLRAKIAKLEETQRTSS
eukprot:g3452.t1